MEGTTPFLQSHAHIASPNASSGGIPTDDAPPDQQFIASMNAQNYPPLPSQTRSHALTDDTLMADMRQSGANTNGTAPVPAVAMPDSAHSHGQGPSTGAMHSFEGPRSPPSGKNTSHVPCKFFRQGACQAGKACPFSHSMDTTTDLTPCKYFAKGNCKFGAKCALAHILPDGRRVNYRHTMPAQAGGHLNLGGRVIPDQYQHQQSALANSLLQANISAPVPYLSQLQFHNADAYHSARLQHGGRTREGIPIIDTNQVTSSGSMYGSPREEERMAFSPKHLTALDAPLPASFESNGISWAARYGPVAASVPSKFGLESPPNSYSRQFGGPSHALRNLHDSAFGSGESTIKAGHANSSSPPMPSSPPHTRILNAHAHRLHLANQSTLSSSAPRAPPSADWDDDGSGNFTFEEDLVPNSLHELLTPQEKMRRYSRTEEDSKRPSAFSPDPTTPSSPTNTNLAASPSSSRFGPFYRTRSDEQTTNGASGIGASAFGHVGSPLRNSSLHPLSHPGNRRTVSGDSSPRVASPPRQSSMSMISQQLQKTRLGSRPDEAYTASSPLGRSNGVGGSMTNGRVASGSSRVAVPRVDEEKEEFVFSMEVEDDVKKAASAHARSPRLNAVSSGKGNIWG